MKRITLTILALLLSATLLVWQIILIDPSPQGTSLHITWVAFGYLLAVSFFAILAQVIKIGGRSWLLPFCLVIQIVIIPPIMTRSWAGHLVVHYAVALIIGYVSVMLATCVCNKVSQKTMYVISSIFILTMAASLFAYKNQTNVDRVVRMTTDNSYISNGDTLMHKSQAREFIKNSKTAKGAYDASIVYAEKYINSTTPKRLCEAYISPDRKKDCIGSLQSRTDWRHGIVIKNMYDEIVRGSPRSGELCDTRNGLEKQFCVFENARNESDCLMFEGEASPDMVKGCYRELLFSVVTRGKTCPEGDLKCSETTDYLRTTEAAFCDRYARVFSPDGKRYFEHRDQCVQKIGYNITEKDVQTFWSGEKNDVNVGMSILSSGQFTTNTFLLTNYKDVRKNSGTWKFVKEGEVAYIKLTFNKPIDLIPMTAADLEKYKGTGQEFLNNKQVLIKLNSNSNRVYFYFGPLRMEVVEGLE